MASSKSNHFLAKISLTLQDKLKKDLEEKGFSFTQPEYTIFLAKKGALSCTLYESGTLMVQGKEKEEFIKYYLEPEILQNLTYSHPEMYVNLSPHIGVDEAGKGDFFGPLCIAGCFADESGIKKLLEMGVKDSKKLSDNSIQKLAKEIKAHFPHSVIRLFPHKYNELYSKFKNLNALLAWGHATVIEDLYNRTSCKEALIDHFADKSVVENAIKRKNLSLHLEQRTGGEADPVVAAASILARDSFVDGIKKLEEELNLPLPKGAASQVITAGKNLVKKYGKEILEKAAKTHFKTVQEVLNDL